jgi:UDP-N-acetylmuramoyl-L-alanyl-D-glutamate--2,6-diaminopimelate ligase
MSRGSLGGWLSGSGDWCELPRCHLQLDSRRVGPGDVFVALAPEPQRSAHVKQAFAQGAVLVLLDAAEPWRGHAYRVIPRPRLAAELGVLAESFYNGPSGHLRFLGVTGTNGKSTCTYLMAQLFNRASGLPAGLVGTLGTGLWNAPLQSHGMTTPDAVSLQAQLRDLVEQGAHWVAMEVSSHGLDQGRVDTLDFHAAVFTNLTRDHLDYHGDMQAYAAAKQRLFRWPSLSLAVLNADDPACDDMASAVPAGAVTWRFALERPADWSARALAFSEQGASFCLHSPFGELQLQSPLLGHFNVQNLLAALAVVVYFYPNAWAKLPAWVSQLQPVRGRMQLLPGSPGQPRVVVDYAHTPDALEQALRALRLHCRGRLWVVFGCGGDRDRGKRPLMAQQAQTWADALVLTSDNPRSESPEAILDDICTGLDTPPAYRHPDRALAIAWAIAQAGPDDWVLLAGKGHETQQILQGQSLPFDDAEEARKALALYPIE